MDSGLPRYFESARDDHEVLMNQQRMDALSRITARVNEPDFQLNVNRRTFLGRAAYGLGGLALACLLEPKLAGRAAAAEAPIQRWKGVIHPPHFPVRAKRVIHLCMAGGPSHLESFDFKPELKRIHGQPFPESFTKG